MAFPFWILGMLAPFLQDALGGDNQNQTTQTTETPAKAPFDPAYSMMSPTVISALLQNYGRMSGAGMPGGQGIDMSFADDILKQLKDSWPDIIGAYGSGDKASVCEKNCAGLPEGGEQKGLRLDLYEPQRPGELIMGYYLGKDMGVVVPGAAAEPPVAPNVPTGQGGASQGASTKEDCAAKAITCNQRCAQKRGGPDFTPCMNDCLGPDCGGGGGGGGGKDGEPCVDGKCATGFTCVDGTCRSGNWIKCSTKCLRDGFRLGTPGWEQCFDNCIGSGGEYCDKNKPCTPPKVCVNGQCVEQPRFCDAENPCPPPQVCVNGKCSENKPCNPPCVPPKVCENGACVDKTTCPDGSGPTYTKNPTACPCGTGWSTLTGKCGTGYYFVKRTDPTNWKEEFPYKQGAIGTCQCTQYYNDWKAGKEGKLGEYEYPAGMQEIMTLLMNRGKENYGYDPRAIEAMFGKNFENLRTAQAGSQEDLNRRLGSQGMLGTGAAVEQGNKLSWLTEKGITDVARDIMIKNEEQKRSDTELLSSILGRGMGYEQLLEAINSGRRGEGQNALMMWLQLLGLLKG